MRSSRGRSLQARFLRREGGQVTPDEVVAAAGGAARDLALPDWVHEWADAVRISSGDSVR